MGKLLVMPCIISVMNVKFVGENICGHAPTHKNPIHWSIPLAIPYTIHRLNYSLYILYMHTIVPLKEFGKSNYSTPINELL